jgi:Flp pilus assembly protein TadD
MALLPFDAASRTRLLVELATTAEPRRLFVFVEGAAKELVASDVLIRVVAGRLIEARAGIVTGPRALLRLALAERGAIDVAPDSPPAPPLTKYPELQPLLQEADANAWRLQTALAPIGGLDSVLVADLDQLMAQLAELPDAASAVLRLVDGVRTVASVLRDAPYDELLSTRIIERLAAAGILHLAAPVPSTTPEPSPPKPAASLPPAPDGHAALSTDDELEGEGVDADIRQWLEHERAPDALLTDDGFLRAFASEAPRERPTHAEPPRNSSKPRPPPPPPPDQLAAGSVSGEFVREARDDAADAAWLEESGIPRERPNRSVLVVALAVVIVVAVLMLRSSRHPSEEEAEATLDSGVVAIVAPPIELVRTETAAAAQTATKTPVVVEVAANDKKPREIPPIAGPDEPEDVKRAEALLNQQSYGEAAKLLSQLRASHPNDPAVWVLSGQLHVDSKGRLDLARESADKAIALDPKYYRAWVLKGSVLQFQGKAKGAEDAYAKALALEPEHPMSAELRSILDQMQKRK